MGQRRPPSADTALPSDGRDDHAPWLHGKSLDNNPPHHKPGSALSPRPVLHDRTPTASADLQLVTLGVGRTAGVPEPWPPSKARRTASRSAMGVNGFRSIMLTDD